MTRNRHSRMSLIFFAVVLSASVIFAHEKPDQIAAKKDEVIVPSESTGLWVTAICGRGCKEPMGSCNVYVLSEKDYEQYTKKQLKLDAKGKTPLLITDINAGIYYVAVESAINTSLVPMTGGGITPLQPDYQKFFMDDLPESMSHVLSSVPTTTPSGQTVYRLVFSLRKWYRVTVTEGTLAPVVAIFLQKQPDTKAWAKYYPPKTSFNIVLPSRDQDEVWDALDDPGQSTHTVSREHRKILTDLLLRGGRVCLPHPEVGVVSVNSKGLLEAIRRIPPENIYGGISSNTVVSPISRCRLHDAEESELKDTVLSSFQKKIPKGRNEVTIRNPDEFSVLVGLRSEEKGISFSVSEKGVNSVFVPDGSYRIYFVYSNDPNALYRGESFTLHANGIEIQIVQVAEGDYSIQRIK